MEIFQQVNTHVCSHHFIFPIININPIITILHILMPQNQFIQTLILQTSLISHLQINVPGHYTSPLGKGLGQTNHLHSHAPHFSAHQKRILIQLLHQQAKHSFQGKNKIL